MDLQFLDWETHMDKKAGLTLAGPKGMATWEYVRRTHPLMVATCGPRGPVTIRREAPWGLSDGACVAHNAVFDASVGYHFAGHKPKFWFDTMSMARYAISQGLLPPDQGVALADFGDKLSMENDPLDEYVTRDVEILRDLFFKLYPLVPEKELRLIDLHIKMASIPRFNLDTEILEPVATGLSPEMEALRSDSFMAEALRNYGVEPTMKQGKRGPGYAFAKTDAFMKKMEMSPDPRVRHLISLRQEAKSSILRTRAARFINIGQPMSAPLLYYGAHTGRSSGSDRLNMQNLPRPGSRGAELRKSLLAPPGYKLVTCDSAQIEVRVLAWLAGEEEVLEAARVPGGDVYMPFAVKLFNKPASQITKAERHLAKTARLALQFGQSAAGLVAYCYSAGVPMDIVTANRITRLFKAANPAIVRYWYENYQQMLRNGGELVLPTGRKLLYPGLRVWAGGAEYDRAVIFSERGPKGKRQTCRLWYGVAAENCTQSVARDVVVLEQTLELAKRWDVVLSIHDEVVMMVPEKDAQEAKEDALRVFSTPPEWAPDLPVAGEAVIADNYGVKP